MKTGEVAADGRVVAGPNWDWLMVYVDGEDLMVHLTDATTFGEASDTEDNGIGASGFNTAKHPEYCGISLPQAGRGIANMHDCPIPKLPWFTPVKVYSWRSAKTCYTHLIDLGPSLFYKGKKLRHGADLSEGTVKALGLSLSDGVYNVAYRIIGGAKYLP